MKKILFLVLLTTVLFSQSKNNLKGNISSTMAQVNIPLILTDRVETDTLLFGLDPTATDGIDASLNEYELPPLPPNGVFDVRFVGDDINIAALGQGVEKDYRQGSSTSNIDSVIHEVRYQTGSGSVIVIKWNLPPQITGKLTDFITGTIVSKDMAGSDSLVISNPSIINKLRMKIRYNFSTSKSINLNVPNGGENWSVGSSRNITWFSSNISTIRIEYTTDNGASWSNVATSVNASSGTYTWSIPNTPSTNCKVKLTDESNGSYTDMSDNVFTISSQPTVQLLQPNGGQNWPATSFQNITWTTSNVQNLKIDYSTNNGVSWIAVASSYPAFSGWYTWTVPNTPSTQCLVRIADASNTSISDVSDNVFTISSVSTITLTSPNGGENLIIGTNHNISWNYNDVQNVKIEYSTNNGSDYILIASSVTAISQSYSWVVPNTPSTQCIVKVSSVENPNLFDLSNSTFTISSGGTISINLTAPNGGETLRGYSFYNITWNSSGISTISIDYSTSNGVFWTNVASSQNASTGTYSWFVPNTPSAQCKVRVRSTADTTKVDISDQVFTIVSPVIILTHPNGGENWIAGTTQQITWSSTHVDKFRIDYTTNNGSSWIQIGYSNSSSYNWVVPNTPTNQAKVRVSDSAYSLFVSDESNNVFTISQQTQSGPISFPLIISDNDNFKDTLIIGLHPQATDGIDNLLGEFELPPVPPSGIFDVRLIGSDIGIPELGQGVDKDLRNGDSLSVMVKEHEIYFQKSSNATNITFNWILPPRIKGKLVDFLGGIVVSDTMIGNGSKVLTNPVISKLKVIVYYNSTTSVKYEPTNPKTFSLMQNYPNPFNPTTTIVYEIPSNLSTQGLANNGFVTLKVFDILGREIATLVNESQQPGRYSINWNAADNTSGTYYYELRIGDYREMKKMILMK